MDVIKTAIPGVVIVEPKVFGDARGYFLESWNQRDFDAAVGPVRFVQDNESKSRYGVLRGLHFQTGDYSQSKLVRVVSGRVLDVAVDIRKGSPWFGQHVCCELSGEAVFQYKCDRLYAPDHEGAIAWDDPALGIDWGLPLADIILSEKDKHHPTLAQAQDLFDYNTDLYAK